MKEETPGSVAARLCQSSYLTPRGVRLKSYRSFFAGSALVHGAVRIRTHETLGGK